MHIPNPTEYLDDLGIDYELIPHITSFTAQQTARQTQIKGSRLSKVVILGSQLHLMMVVIPADCSLQLESLAKHLKLDDLQLVSEEKFKDRFPRCEIGAMPPFGNIYGMNVFVAQELLSSPYIIFNGGTHNLLIRMDTEDFQRITGAEPIKAGYRRETIQHPIISRRKDDRARV
ncbi:aminoacyl-tRNA deacylase [Aliikangiella sp. G2MR2-5]|uniref:aminoacyl-tRNA deacylase n=1 Tax=Aliikangiella sp. G2MR2-5 TaxID=2788943 RepID=UPI0018A9C7D3|nr:YbaK/EbsC family protein [Aliikangiella sp. G2MR2-5]